MPSREAALFCCGRRPSVSANQSWGRLLGPSPRPSGNRRQPFAELDLRAPRIGDEGDKHIRLRHLPVADLERNSIRLELLGEGFEVADLEADVIDRTAGR